LLVLTAPLTAQTITNWVGGTDTNWNTAANWDTGVMPDGTKDVTIDLHATNNVVVLSSGITNLNGHMLTVGDVNYTAGQPASSLTIQGGAKLTSGGSFINNADSSGTVTVTGTGSQWTNNGVTIGYTAGYPSDVGLGTLNITSGGVVTTFTGDGNVGYSGGNGTAMVDGAGSAWNISNGLNVGLGITGSGSVTVSNGGVITTGSGAGSIATADFAQGSVTITGTGSRWDTHGDVNVGGPGSGTLVISAGATLNMINSGFGTIGTGTLGGGVSSVTVTGAGSSWNPFALTIGGTYTGATLIISNGGTVTTTVGSIESGTGPAMAAASILGHGSTWTNNGFNFDIGTTGSGSLILGSGGQFITKGLTLGAGSQLQFLLGGTSAATDYGSISFSAGGSSTVTLAGELDVNLVNSFNPAAGATFQLFNFNGAAVSGTFGTINLPTLGGGETWDISGLYTSGDIVVTGTAVPEPAACGTLAGLAVLGLALVRRRLAAA
jgi:T5SS/PEP-CTERM-associated repeat protein